MARITVQDCLAKVGNENRFSLIHLAVKRVKQHRNGQPFIVQCKNKEVVSTLREIATGDVNFDNINEFDRMPEELDVDLESTESETPESSAEQPQAA